MLSLGAALSSVSDEGPLNASDQTKDMIRWEIQDNFWRLDQRRENWEGGEAIQSIAVVQAGVKVDLHYTILSLSYLKTSIDYFFSYSSCSETP